MINPGFRITRYDTPRRYNIYQPKHKSIRNSLHLAFSKSFSSRVHTGKHCAVLLDESYNIVKTFVNCYKENKSMGTIHAEEGLLKEVLTEDPHFDFSKCMIVVVRGNLLGRFSNSAPCDNCLCLMKCNKVGRIVFTTTSGLKILCNE